MPIFSSSAFRQKLRVFDMFVISSVRERRAYFAVALLQPLILRSGEYVSESGQSGSHSIIGSPKKKSLSKLWSL